MEEGVSEREEGGGSYRLDKEILFRIISTLRSGKTRLAFSVSEQNNEVHCSLGVRLPVPNVPGSLNYINTMKRNNRHEGMSM